MQPVHIHKQYSKGTNFLLFIPGLVFIVVILLYFILTKNQLSLAETVADNNDMGYSTAVDR